LSDSAQLAGVIILENGGETYRAEETAIRICEAGGCSNPDVLALPTGIFISLAPPDESDNSLSHATAVTRIKNRSTDLLKVQKANSIARLYTSGKISLEELYKGLRDIAQNGRRKLLVTAIGSAVASAAFSALFGGNLFDCAVALFCGFFVDLIASLFERSKIYHFAISFIGGLLITVSALGFTSLFHMGSIDKIIVGAMTPLLPGLSLTNAIRDTVMGDIVSGTSRLTEALLIAISLAGSVGSVLAIYIGLGGVI